MRRRNFLKSSFAGAIGLPVVLNKFRLGALPVFPFFNSGDDRVLVLIQLSGGNDGLAMMPPLQSYDNLAKARPQLVVGERTLLKLDATTGLHPVMTGLKSLWDDGKLGVVHSVGYPNQNRSHFRSTDIWTSGSGAEEYVSTGWLGRFLDKNNPGYPQDYPSAEHPAPFALTMSPLVTETCQGLAGNFSLAISNPFQLSQLVVGQGGAVPNTPYGRELAFIRSQIVQTNKYSDRILSAARRGVNLAQYPLKNSLATQLKNVALLLSGGLQTRIFICTLGGFDTHGNQVDKSDPSIGAHATLLGLLSDALLAFQHDLVISGNADRVLGMTFSEFGRQIRSNASLGSDHGNAAPLLLFGNCVVPGFVGFNANISNQVALQEAVPMQFDFRDVYGTVLRDWFGQSESDIRHMLYPGFSPLPLLAPCGSSGVESIHRDAGQVMISAHPNPFREHCVISFVCESEPVRVRLFDALGQIVAEVLDRRLTAGEHFLTFDGTGFPKGNYYLHIQTVRRVSTTQLVKI
jgi:uncharacterized protein (DUF1501 family)